MGVAAQRISYHVVVNWKPASIIHVVDEEVSVCMGSFQTDSSQYDQLQILNQIPELKLWTLKYLLAQYSSNLSVDMSS
jgi:hypothetical protein